MTRMHVPLSLLVGLVVCGACTDDDSAQGGDAGESAGGAQGSGAASAYADGGVSTSQAGATGQAATAGAAGGGCEGDAEAWNAIIARAPACETDADCCVVVNSCLAEAHIVHADDFEAAVQAWPYCQQDCTDCIPPAVIVACDNGQCVGTIDAESDAIGDSHCGDTAPLGNDPAQSFSCGG